MSNTKEMSKRQARREQIRRKETRGRLIAITLVTVGALALAFLIFGNSLMSTLRPIASIATVQPNPRPQANNNSMGNPDAPIKILEYSDFQCPFCKRFYTQTEQALIDAYISTGKVYFTYHSAGNWVSSHGAVPSTESEDAAQAAYCGGDQGKFWEMHDMLFNNNRDVEDQGSFEPRRLSAIAKAAGLDAAQFDKCFSGQKYKAQVDQDGKDATTAGVNGTPTFVLSYKDATGKEVSKLIEGAQPIDVFKTEIDAALTALGK